LPQDPRGPHGRRSFWTDLGRAIKVDRSFTAQLPDDATSATIIRATVGLATDLGLACIVEGVETRAQLAALPSAAGLLVQGYLFSQAQPVGARPPRFMAAN
jgi:EAL domain-containing protein (putative c-di-GMP-specific phosphodiesterase class I)